MFLRAATALVGGYLLASLFSAFLARFLPMAPAEATGMALVLSFGLYAAILLWVFTAGGKKTSEREKSTLRRSMAWIHGWLGLLGGWLCFVIFLTGTASYFQPEITRWMQPERTAVSAPAAEAATVAVEALQRTSPDALRWTIFLPSDRDPATKVYVAPRPGAGSRPAPRKLDPHTGEPVGGRATEGGALFYHLHYTFLIGDPWGKYLAGIAAMAMLSAIVSGVITHKRIFADFFTMRWRQGQRSWLDGHNLAAVLGLPFHAVITYSGLVILATLYMPLVVRAQFADTTAFYAVAYADGPTVSAPSGNVVQPVPIADMIHDAERRWNGVPASSVTIQYPGDQASIVTIVARPGSGLGARGPSLSYSGASGEMLAASAPDGAGLSTLKTLFGLHLAIFAGEPLRWLLFVLGLAGTAMVGTGLHLWTVKRAREGDLPGIRLVRRLNIATIACLPAAMAAYFLANRLIPAEALDRSASEIRIFFGVWAGLALAAGLRPVARAWVETLAIAAGLFLLVPIVDAAAIGLPRDALFVTFDLTMIASAALLGFAAWKASHVG